MTNQIPIITLNNISEIEFSSLFGNIVEYYPSITQHLFKKRPYKNVSEFIENAMTFLDSLNTEEKEHVLKLHPDLAGKLADEGKLTSESKKEQKSAGLDAITPEEKQSIVHLNQKYKEKFGFPFVICARENNFESITKELKRRLINTKENEIQTGFEEVKKISKLRLLDLLTE